MKYIGIVITLVLTLLGFAVGYGMLQQKAETTAIIVEKHDEAIVEIKEIDIRQSMIMERNTQLLDKLEKRF